MSCPIEQHDANAPSELPIWRGMSSVSAIGFISPLLSLPGVRTVKEFDQLALVDTICLHNHTDHWILDEIVKCQLRLVIRMSLHNFPVSQDVRPYCPGNRRDFASNAASLS